MHTRLVLLFSPDCNNSSKTSQPYTTHDRSPLVTVNMRIMKILPACFFLSETLVVYLFMRVSCTTFPIIEILNKGKGKEVQKQEGKNVAFLNREQNYNQRLMVELQIIGWTDSIPAAMTIESYHLRSHSLKSHLFEREMPAKAMKSCGHATFCFNKNRSSNHGLFWFYRQQNTVPNTKLQHWNQKISLTKFDEG